MWGDDGIRNDALALTLREKLTYVSTLDDSGAPETRVMYNTH